MTVPLKIAIIGCRGIPNNYGGFEQFAQYLSVGLVNKGHNVTVYNSRRHAWKGATWKGVNIIHCLDPENYLGTIGQFIYDLNCILDSRKRDFDIILFLGYTSSSVWWRLFPKKPATISNMDGLEWKRTKYIYPARLFLKYAEKLAVRHSDYLIADSTIIQGYLEKTYQKNSNHISYGADIISDDSELKLQFFDISKDNYYLVIARLEPENNILMILQGFHRSGSTKKMIVLGNEKNRFGKYLVNKFKQDKRIFFLGSVYDKITLHQLRSYCSLYFHGHSVGGTNPSLLEAMADKAVIASHNNEFNRAVLNNNAFYFSSSEDITDIIEKSNIKDLKEWMTINNFNKINHSHSWNDIVEEYEKFFMACVNNSKG